MDNIRNIVLITVDSLRADHVGVMNKSLDIETSNIDAIGKEGVVCDRAFSAGPYTRASFPSILTGTYAWFSDDYMNFSLDGRPHIADRFSNSGYSTGGFHSNGFLSDGTGYERGFDIFFDNLGTAAEIESMIEKSPLSSVLLPLGRRIYPQISRYLDYLSGLRKRSNEAGREPYLLAEELNQKAIEWMSSTEDPFFCWIHYMDVHVPNYPRENTVSEDIPVQRAQEVFEKSGSNDPKDLTPDELMDFRTLYKGEIEYLDRHIGELVDWIDENFDTNNTAFVFFSDHGESLGEHDHLRHGSRFHAGVTHVPFFIRVPGIEGNVEAPVSGIDVMPTLLDCAELDTPAVCRGESVIEQISDTSQSRFVFAQSGLSEGGKVMVTDGELQLVTDGNSDISSFFKFSEGTSDIVDPEEIPADRLAELEDAIEAHIEMFDNKIDSSMSRVDSGVSDDVEKRLEELGYKDV